MVWEFENCIPPVAFSHATIPMTDLIFCIQSAGYSFTIMGQVIQHAGPTEIVDIVTDITTEN